MRQEPAEKGKRKGRPRTDAEIEDAIKRWATETDRTPTQIYRVLERMKQDGKIARVPGLRTIESIVARCKKDDSGPWSLTDDSAEDTALIFPVLADLLEHTEGQAKLTKAQAKLVIKVARNAPGLHPEHVYRLAVAYQRRGKDDTADLDVILAFRPWENRDAMFWFQDWVRDHHPEWLRHDSTYWFHPSVPAEVVAAAREWAPAVEGMFIVMDMWMDQAVAMLRIRNASLTKGTVPGPDPRREALLRLQRQRRREGNAEPLPEEDNDEQTSE